MKVIFRYSFLIVYCNHYICPHFINIMKTIQGLLFTLITLFVQQTALSQPQCVGFKADFVFEKDTTAGVQIKFTNTSTWTDSNTYYLWNYGDGQQKLIFEENHTFTTTGNYNVCLYIYKLIGGDTVCRSRTCNTVSVIASVETDAQKPIISLYPNPVADFLTIYTENTAPLQLIITDIVGREVITASFTQQTTIPTATLAQGIYYVEVKNASGVVYREKIKK